MTATAKITLTGALKAWLVEHAGAKKDGTDAEFQKALAGALSDNKLTFAKLAKLADETSDDDDTPDPNKVFARVKGSGERYSTKRATAVHAKTGQPVRDEHGREVELPSERDYAKAGALLKYQAGRSGLPVVLTDHERGLVEETFEKDSWCGQINGEWRTGIPGDRAKALISDSTSGGVEVNPEWFDAAIVTFPLLTGELFPFVDLRDVPRAKSVEGASIGNPTVTWNTAEGSALTPFTTDALVAGIDTSLFPVACAVEIGRDFMADAAVDVGRVLVENIGQRMMSELDRVIAVGNGTTEPQGITVASGLATVSSVNGNAGPPEVTDYEGLMFAVGKQYRTAANRMAFIANDTSYRRSRAIPVSGTDQRRVFGMDHSSYTLLEHPYRVNNSIANTTVAYGALAKYRMYRRSGFEVKFEQGGKTLTLANLALLYVRGRFGGRVMDAGAFAKTTNAQS